MKRVPLLVVLALALVLGPVAPAQAQSAVTGWIDLELDAIASHSVNPPRASRELAHLSGAMYGAALAGGQARDDAVAGAASTVIRYFHPDAAVRIDALAGQLATGSRAFAGGRVVGQLLVARAQRYGADAVWTGTPPQGPGYWVPTPPGYVYPPLEPLAGTWKTWNIESGSAFRPGPPPEYDSPQFLTEMQEVYDVSQHLTDEQKRIALYWADGAGTVTPPGHWNVIAEDLVRAVGWGTLRTARLFATLNTAQGDAFIACWDAKFAYWSIRPITAIRRLLDPDWTSLIVTPPFPSYVSATRAPRRRHRACSAHSSPRRPAGSRRWPNRPRSESAPGAQRDNVIVPESSACACHERIPDAPR